MYSVAAIVNNVIAYLKIAKRAGLKSSHVKKILNYMVTNINWTYVIIISQIHTNIRFKKLFNLLKHFLQIAS